MEYGTDLWDSYKRVVERNKNGKAGTSSIQNMMRKKQIKSLKGMKLRTDKFGEMGEIMKSVGSFMKTLSNLYQEHSTDMKSIRDDLKQKNKELDKCLKENSKKETKARKELASQNSKVRDAKKKDHGDGKKWEDSRKKVEEALAIGETQEKKLIKLQKSEKQCKEKSEKSKEDYKNEVDKLEEVDKNYYGDMEHILNELQKIDTGRLEYTKGALVEYCDLMIKYAEKEKQEAENMKKIIETIDPDEYVQKFIKKAKTGKSIPPPADFEPYDDDGVEKRTRKPRNQPKKTKKSEPKKKIQKKNEKKQKKTTEKNTGSKKKSLKEVEVTADWDPNEGLGEDDDPEQYLMLKQGATIEVLEENEEGWWLGRIGNKEGYFPKTFIQEKKGGSSSSKKIEKKVQPGLNPKPVISNALPDDDEDEEGGEMDCLGECVVENEYDAESESELSMRLGEKIKILVKNQDGWWFGKNTAGETGYFPSNFTDVGRLELDVE